MNILGKKHRLIMILSFISVIFLFMFMSKTAAHAESTTTAVYWKLDGGVLTLRSDQIDSSYAKREAGSTWSDKWSLIEQVEIANTIAPSSTSYWFDGCSNLTTITNLTNLDTSNVTNMNSMFSGCSKLTSLDLSSFDTPNVTSAANMFNSCNSLNEIHTPATIGTVALPLPARFMYAKADSDGKHTLITSISSEDANKTINRHAACSGGTATCTQKGVCSTCRNEYGNFGDHSFTTWAYDETNHWHGCINCGESQGDEATHSGTDDHDCTTAVTCS